MSLLSSLSVSYLLVFLFFVSVSWMSLYGLSFCLSFYSSFLISLFISQFLYLLFFNLFYLCSVGCSFDPFTSFLSSFAFPSPPSPYLLISIIFPSLFPFLFLSFLQFAFTVGILSFVFFFFSLSALF